MSEQCMDCTPTVKIGAVQQNGSTVTVVCTAANLNGKRVEIIVNEDINKRYVAKCTEDGGFECSFTLPHNGTYAVEASIRDYADFNKLRQATSDDTYFYLTESNVWGATVTRHTDGLYYMLMANWDTVGGFKTDWFHYSEIGCAVSNKLLGPYFYLGKALDASYVNTTHKTPVKWNYAEGPATLDVFHNPTVMRSERDGKYYLYFMGSSTDDKSLSHSRQRVGVAFADSPRGPWTIVDHPVLDIRSEAEGGWEWRFTANPSVTEVKQPDGSYLYYALYKGSGTYDGQRLTATGVGTAPTPMGPFTRSPAPIMRDLNVGFSVEDCFVWHSCGKYYAMAKDMTKGNWTGVTGAYSYALFESTDGIKWGLSEHKLAFKNEIPWESGVQTVHHYERSQLYIEDTIPFLLCNATTVKGTSPYKGDIPYNVQVPLLGVALATDTCEVTVSDLADEKQPDFAGLEALLLELKDIREREVSREMWKIVENAIHGAKIILRRNSTDAADVDFATAHLARVLAMIHD